jgi:hypothetical protein
MDNEQSLLEACVLFVVMIKKAWKKNGFLVAFVMLVLLGLVVPLFMNMDVAAASEIHVLPGQSIQEAINNAVDGDTIIVQNGIHIEGQYPVFLNRSITLAGQSVTETVINGNGTDRGILLVKANGVRVFNLTIQNTTENFAVSGVSLVNVMFTEVSNCILTNCGSGLGLTNSSENNVTRNNIRNNKSFGVYLHSASSSNIISGNNVTGNPTGISIADTSCQHNMIYHNNFVANTNQQTGSGTSNGWDDGYPSGGNYWDDHANDDMFGGIGQNETGSDGIADTSYHDIDAYPLVEPMCVFYMYTWSQLDYYVLISSNSTVYDFQFDPNVGKFVVFKAVGFVGTVGCCRVVLPKDILWVQSAESWMVTLNETIPATSPFILEDLHNTYVFLSYDHSTQMIKIAGTCAVPEYSLLALALLLTLSVASLVSVAKSRAVSQIKQG